MNTAFRDTSCLFKVLPVTMNEQISIIPERILAKASNAENLAPKKSKEFYNKEHCTFQR